MRSILYKVLYIVEEITRASRVNNNIIMIDYIAINSSID